MRQRRDDVNIRLRDSRVNHLRGDRQVADHRVVAENVPRGGVVNARRPGRQPGRSGAESIDDAEHGATIKNAMVRRLDRSLRP